MTGSTLPRVGQALHHFLYLGGVAVRFPCSRLYNANMGDWKGYAEVRSAESETCLLVHF